MCSSSCYLKICFEHLFWGNGFSFDISFVFGLFIRDCPLDFPFGYSFFKKGFSFELTEKGLFKGIELLFREFLVDSVDFGQLWPFNLKPSRKRFSRAFSFLKVFYL